MSTYSVDDPNDDGSQPGTPEPAPEPGPVNPDPDTGTEPGDDDTGTTTRPPEGDTPW